MKIRAAVLHKPRSEYSIETIELDPPQRGEVLVKIHAVGLCHSDEHLVTGDLSRPEDLEQATGWSQYPIIAGHEVAAEVVETGPEVHDLKVGDHVLTSFVPSCGYCEMCTTGRQALCDRGANALMGHQLDGTSRHHLADGSDLTCICSLGGFAEYSVMPRGSLIPIEPHFPMPQAALVSCGVITGWGSATYAGQVAAGDTVVVVGTGGVGMNAVQGAALAGARNVIAVDPEPLKRDSAPIFGATHTASNLEDAASITSKLTYNRMADVAIIAMGLNDPAMLGTVTALVRKAGRVVLTSVTARGDEDAKIDLLTFAMNRKQLIGCLFGNANPRYDVPRLLKLYEAGRLKLDELITNTYSLDQLNQGYQDMRDGKNLRGVLVF